MASENIVTGKKYRILIDEINKIWARISFWTKSKDVEYNDGLDAETKNGAINGITSDLSCEDESIAVSAKAVNDSLGGITNFIVDETTGKITGYRTEIGGADTVFPFSNNFTIYGTLSAWTQWRVNSGSPFQAGYYCRTQTVIVVRDGIVESITGNTGSGQMSMFPNNIDQVEIGFTIDEIIFE